jgi:hypothetical protein
VADEREQGSGHGREVRLDASGGEARFGGGDVSLRIDRVRLLNEFRLAVLSIILGLGLTVLFGVQQEAGWLWGALAGLGSIAGVVILFRWRRSRNAIARALDWVVGRG